MAPSPQNGEHVPRFEGQQKMPYAGAWHPGELTRSVQEACCVEK